MRAFQAIGLLWPVVSLACGCGAGAPEVETGPAGPPDAGAEAPPADAGGEVDAGAPAREPLDPALQELLDRMDVERDPVALDELARALGDHPHPAAVGRLIVLLASEQDRIRAAAIDSLDRLGEAAVEPLIEALETAEPKQRDRMIERLAAIGDRRAIPALIRMLPATAENGSAARALTRFRDTAVPALLEALEGDVRATRVQAAVALELMTANEAITAALVAALDDEWAPVRAQAASALGTHGTPAATEPLVALLDDRDVAVRVAATGALGRIGTPETVDPLERALADEDPLVRCAAAGALVEIGDPKVVRLLYSAVADVDYDVRERARSAVCDIVTHQLGGKPGREIVDRLVDMLGSDDPAARASAAYLLGDLHAGKAARPLGKLLRDTDADARWAALTALKDLEDRSSAGPLIGALRDEDPQIRAGAAELLGSMAIPRAAQALARSLTDPEPEVRRAAADALASIAKRSAVGPLIKALGDEDAGVAEAARQALDAIGDPATAKLVAAFKQRARSTAVRVALAGLLGHRWKPGAVTALIDALRDPDEEVARIAHLTLEAMACTQLPPDPAEWRSWWRDNRKQDGPGCKGKSTGEPDPQEHPPLW